MIEFASLLYHCVDNVNKYGHISPRTFSSQMKLLIENGFVIEGFDGLKRRMESNTWPERYVVLTFDDGLVSDLYVAEILREVGAKATFFLPTRACQTGKRHLKADDIKELATLSDIGSHTVTHTPLTLLSKEEMWRELVDSKEWLEGLIGREIDTISAPHGSLNNKVIQTILRAGYRLVGGSHKWWNHPSKIFVRRVVNRISIDHSTSTTAFLMATQCNPYFYSYQVIRSVLLMLPKALLVRYRSHPLIKKVFSTWGRSN